MLRTANQRLQDGLNQVNEIIERTGINFPKEVNAIVESVHEHISEYDWKKFVLDVSNDQYKVKSGVDYHAHRIYCTVYLMYSQNIKFNEKIFADLMPMVVSYFEELEEYEKCEKLLNVTFEDVNYYAPPYEILIHKD